MNPTGLVLNINSADRDRLHNFYRDVVQLQIDPVFGLFSLGPTGIFFIDGHSELTGPTTPEPARSIFSITLDDRDTFDAEHQRLVDAGVPCIREKGTEIWGGVMSTFVDPDGNYFQLMHVPSADPETPIHTAGA